jgi:hypothetical protein
MVIWRQLSPEITAIPELFFVKPQPLIMSVARYHDRGDFISQKVNGKFPPSHGAICAAADAWIYWYHDFKAQQLDIQRVRVPTANETHTQAEALASLLLDAFEEAHKWGLSKVVVWSPCSSLVLAMQLLADKFGIKVEHEEQMGTSVPSLRWKGPRETRITFHHNEFYAYS